MIEFFERLDKFMIYKGLNDNKITIETGISNGLIGKARKKGGGISLENISKILNTYPELSVEWLLTGNGDMLKENNQKQKNMGDNSTLNNINGKVKGNITISHNQLADFVDLHKQMNEIIKTTQSQLTESQKQVTNLIEILKTK